MIQNAKVVGENISPEVYARQEPGIERGNPQFVMSRSELMAFANCPHKWLKVGSGFERNDASEWGSAIDCLLLTPSRFEIDFLVKPATYPDAKTGEPKPFTASSNWCKEWLAKNDDGSKTLIKADEFARMREAILAFGDSREVMAILPKAKKQVMCVAEWNDRATGITVPIKVLLDLVPDASDPQFGKVLFDLKTTTNASQEAWQSKVFKMHYCEQAALFLDVYRAATGEDRLEFWHIVQEDEPPYEVAIWPLSTGADGETAASVGFVGLGRMKYESAMERYCQCLKTGIWHGYNPNSQTYLEPALWMINK